MPRFWITISSRSPEKMVDLVLRYKIEVSDHGSRRDDEVGFSVHATATDQQINFLTSQGYLVVTHEQIPPPGDPQ